MAFKELNPTEWKPTVNGDSVEGTLCQVQENIGKNDSMLYNLETAEGIKSVWGSAILNSRMALVKVGDKIRITYKGLSKDAKEGRNPAKIFMVEIDR